MAHIVTLGEGRNKRYKVVYEIKTPDGSRKRKSTTLPAGTSKSVADDLKRKIEYEAMVGELELTSNRSDITLKEFYETVYVPTYSMYLSPSTLSGYESLWGNSKNYSIKNTLGSYKLNMIKRKDVQFLINTIVNQGLSPKTVRAYYSFLCALFDKAILCEYISPAKNPTTSIILPQKQYTERKAFTIEQAQQLIEAARNKSLNDLTIVELGLMAGLRRSEIGALKFQDWDEENAILHIRQAKLCVDKETIIKSTKTRSGTRSITLPDELQNTLRLMKKDYIERKLKYGKAFVDSEYIITNEDGKDKSVATISTIYQRLIQSMPDGFPQYGLHCLRHTYTTFLVTSPNGNTDIKSISELLGHSSTQFTLDVYTHSALERKRQATANLDMLVKKSS
ncbi:MAG: site-specific integrase [Acutalibacteraceae bacterium]|nr:site-specific integrase [Acutalibacteraceae bacterium]